MSYRLPNYKHKALLRFIREREKETAFILDVGSNDGVIIERLKGKYKVAIDNSKWMLDRNFSKNKVLVDITKRFPFPDNYFDYCIFSEVAEHLPPNKLPYTLKEMYRVTKQSGRVYLTTPNNSMFRKFKFYFIKKNVAKIADEHEKEYSIKEMSNLALTSGFYVEEKAGIAFVAKYRIFDFIGEMFPFLSAKMLLKLRKL